MDLHLNADAHIYLDTTIETYRSGHDDSPVVRIGDSRLTLFFGDDAAARRFANEILTLVGSPNAEENAAEKEELASLRAFKRNVDESLNSGDGVYRP